MENIRLSRKVVIAIAAAFAVLLIAGFWWRLNPAFDQNPYMKDAARLQAEEQNLGPIKKDDPTSVPASVPSDQRYQPESGNN